MDGPMTGMTEKESLDMITLIKEIRKRGITVVFVEQNARMALSLAHRGYVIETGRIVLKDDDRALLNNEQVKQAYLWVCK